MLLAVTVPSLTAVQSCVFATSYSKPEQLNQPRAIPPQHPARRSRGPRQDSYGTSAAPGPADVSPQPFVCSSTEQRGKRLRPIDANHAGLGPGPRLKAQHSRGRGRYRYTRTESALTPVQITFRTALLEIEAILVKLHTSEERHISARGLQ